MDDPMKLVFKKLLENKRLPDYQFERRVDIFFEMFMKEIIEGKFKNQTVKNVIPEFPIKKGVVGEVLKENEKPSNRSDKVDFLIVTNSDVFYTVELKTDMGSFENDKEQQSLSKGLSTKSLFDLINGLEQIFSATQAKGKYGALIERLGKYYPNNELLKGIKIQSVYLTPFPVSVEAVVNIDFESITKFENLNTSFKEFIKEILENEKTFER